MLGVLALCLFNPWGMVALPDVGLVPVDKDFSNQHILAFALAITTYLLVDSLIVSVVMSLVSQKPVLITAHWNLKSLLRECAEISIGCIGAIFALINPLLLLFVVAPCCLAVNHLRVNQSAQLSKRDTRTGLLNEISAQRNLHDWSITLRDCNEPW